MNMPLPTLNLRAFEATARYLSMTEAAKEFDARRVEPSDQIRELSWPKAV